MALRACVNRSKFHLGKFVHIGKYISHCRYSHIQVYECEVNDNEESGNVGYVDGANAVSGSEVCGGDVGGGSEVCGGDVGGGSEVCGGDVGGESEVCGGDVDGACVVEGREVAQGGGRAGVVRTVGAVELVREVAMEAEKAVEVARAGVG